MEHQRRVRSVPGRPASFLALRGPRYGADFARPSHQSPAFGRCHRHAGTEHTARRAVLSRGQSPGIDSGGSIVVHQLRQQDVKGSEALENTLADFCRFIAGSVLVGHFVEIDLKILRKEMIRTGQKLDHPAVDTARVHHWILRHGPYSEDLHLQLEQLDLSTLAKFYRVDIHDAHHALSDAFLTARVWQKMLYALEEKGIGNLRKLLKIGGR